MMGAMTSNAHITADKVSFDVIIMYTIEILRLNLLGGTIAKVGTRHLHTQTTSSTKFQKSEIFILMRHSQAFAVI
jgi:hypothetical protein